ATVRPTDPSEALPIATGCNLGNPHASPHSSASSDRRTIHRMRRIASLIVVFLMACGRAVPNAGPVDAMGSGGASDAEVASADAARDAPSEAGAIREDGAEASAVEAGENEASGTDLRVTDADGSVYDASEFDTSVLDEGLVDASPQEDADAGANDGRAPTTADNPPIPTGYKLLSQADLTPAMTAWATSILNDPTDYPLFATATQTFGTLVVLARVEWQPPDFQNAAVHRGVTLYEPL
ncbi:MAG TPA: hypothetical protein VN894_01415, partial [Polyangiaceae bacterium]|nr:hypothetical protein [Polyangiaceae bacterium]